MPDKTRCRFANKAIFNSNFKERQRRIRKKKQQIL